MKILFLSMNFAPELTGVGKYSGETVQGLLARGHEVSVVCAPPYYPQWQVQPGYSAARYSVERPQPGLTVYRCPLWVPRRASGLKRLLHQASFALACLPVLLWLALWRPAVVFAVAPALFTAPLGWLAARLCGARAWLHVQDLEVDAAFELGLLKGRIARRALLGFERRLLRSFDVVSTISRRMLRQLASKGLAMDSAELVPNWVDLQQIHPVDRSPALRASLGITDEQTVFLFSGTMNRKQGLHVLVEAARQLQHRPEVVIVICGSGEVREGLEQAAAGLPNLRFIDLQPADQLNALLNMADAHLLPQMRGAADLVMPSKLTGMLASGRPVIAAVDRGTEISAIVNGRGRVIEAESAEAFTAAMAELAADAPLRRELGEAARAYAVQVLDYRAVMSQLDHSLERLNAQAAVPLPERSRV